MSEDAEYGAAVEWLNTLERTLPPASSRAEAVDLLTKMGMPEAAKTLLCDGGDTTTAQEAGMFGKDAQSRAEKVQAALDPAFANRQWSVLDAGNGARMRDVMRAYEQIKVTERLIEEQQETNRLLQALLERGQG